MEPIQKRNTIPEALVKSIFEKAASSKEFTDALNLLTGIILEAAEEARGTHQDVEFHDAFHCEVHNEILDGTRKAVQLVVDNWEAPT